MKFKLSGVARVNYNDIEVEAENAEEAIVKLETSLNENPAKALDEDHAYGGKLLDEPKVTAAEARYTVRCHDIEYKANEFDLGNEEIANLAPIDWDDQDSVDAAIKEYEGQLPQDIEIIVTCEKDDLYKELSDAISERANGVRVVNFKYDIIKAE